MKVSRKNRLPPVANMEAFLAVARSRSVTVAAEELFLTQGAVSRQILDLEKFVGVSLFSRGPRGLELTTAGHDLAAKLQPMLSQLEELFVAVRSPGSESLNVSLTPSLGLEYIHPAANEFLDAHPDYVINFITLTGEVDLEEEDGVDVAVISGKPRSNAGDPELLFSPSFYAYISTALVPASAASDLSVLYRHKLIGQMRHPDAWPDFFGRLGLVYSPNMVRATHSMLSAAAQAVLDGTGIALLPDYVARKHVTAGRMRRVCDTAYVPRQSSYYLVSRKSVRERRIYVDFRAWITALCRAIDTAPPPA